MKQLVTRSFALNIAGMLLVQHYDFTCGCFTRRQHNRVGEQFGF
jgi:hypothetical protein